MISPGAATTPADKTTPPEGTALPASKRDPLGINHNLPKDQYTHVIALVHGIRDIGAWQQTVSSELMVVRGVQVVQIRYGLFSAWRFLFPLPLFFAGPIRQVANGLNNLRNEYPNARLSVIAHSFGTFLTLRVLRQNPLIQLWKVVFCGSVADDLVDWASLRNRVGDGKLPTREFIVNDCGTGDHWPVLGTAFGWCYGMAGAVGFSEEYVTNRFHRGAGGTAGGHSLYFDPKFVAEKWKPFLIDEAPIGSGDGRQGEHLPAWIRVFYNPLAQWIARLATLAVWLAPPVLCLWLALSHFAPSAAPSSPGKVSPATTRTTIRVGIKQWVGYTPLAVAHKMGFFGDRVEVVLVDVDTIEQMRRELAEGQLEFAMALVESHVRASEDFLEDAEDGNRPVAIVKLDTSRGADGILAAENIQSVTQLGKVDGEERYFLFQQHDVSHFLLKHLFQEAGIAFRDLKAFAESRSPEASAELFADSRNQGTRKYFAAGTYEPFLTYVNDPKNERFHAKGSHLLIHSDDIGVRNMVVDIMVTKQQFLEKNRPAVASLLKGWFRAVDILNDKSNPEFPSALEHALRFNGLPRDGADWSAKHWSDNTPCTTAEFEEMIDGLRGRFRNEAEKEKPWPDREENAEFFKRVGGHASKFDEAFGKCKQLREGRNLEGLDPRNFDGSSVLLELSE